MKTQMEGEPDVLSWVAELQRGERVEVNSRRIFRRYYGWVRGFFTRRRFPVERAEELTQETFLQAFQRITSFRAGGTFESWLFAIAANLHRNEIRNLARQKRAAPEVSIEAVSPANGVEAVEGSTSPEESALENERSEALEQAISALPENPQVCIRLRLAGHGYAAIAEILRLSPSTARVHVFTARQRLREKLGQDFGERDG